MVHQGYLLYQEAIEGTSIKEKVESIRSKKNYTYLDEIPEIYKKAVIAVEDNRFYAHGGIDPIAIFRAIIHDIEALSPVEGGSSITQQLAKNTYFTQEKKITRKIAEAFMAIKLEEELEKDEILELYINTCYYGEGYYNIKDACKGYFKKEVKDMTDYECTMLAGIPNAPSVYAPTKNLELAKQRQEQVLDSMVRYNTITKKEAEEILKEGE